MSALPPVVVVHGFLATKATNLPVHWTLWRRGFRTVDVELPGLNTQDPRVSADAVAAAVDRVLSTEGETADRAHLVGVSLGGLIGLAYLRDRGGARIHRFVSMGSPLQGTDLAWLAHASRPVLGRLQASRTLASMGPDTDLIRWLNAEPVAGTEVYTMFHPDDPMVPHPSALLPWATQVQAPVGRYPTAHHEMLLHPTNRALLADILQQGPEALLTR